MAKGPGKGRRDPLLEIPGARANPVHAGQCRVWSDEAAAAYSLGLDPKTVTPELAERLQSTSWRAQEYLRRLELFRQGIIVGELAEPMRPSLAVKWAEQIPFSFPKAVVAAIREIPLVEASRTQPAGGGVDPRVHKNTQLLLATVCRDSHDFKRGAQRNKATAQLKTSLASKGVQMDEETILERVREADRTLDEEIAKQARALPESTDR